MTEAGCAERSFEKLWLIINEKCVTKCSSYTGVEELKCAMNNLSEYC